MLQDFYYGPWEPDDAEPVASRSAPAAAFLPDGSAAKRPPRPEAPPEPDLQSLLAGENVMAAWERVRRNRGCAGVDGESIADLAPRFPEAWAALIPALNEGSWRPRPLLRVSIPKSDGGTRILGIPAVMDRVVAQALAQTLAPSWEPRFSPASFAYRRGRSTLDALTHARAHLATGRGTCLHLDIENFFDTIPHPPLLQRLRDTPCDPARVELARHFLTAPVLERGTLLPTRAGVAQGSPLSPLLANIALDPADHWLGARGVPFTRYADDILILAESPAEARSFQAAAADHLATCGLRLNPAKTRITGPEECVFLGFTFFRGADETWKPAVSDAALLSCRKHLKELRSLDAMEQFLVSWHAYFRHSERPSDWRGILDFAESECGFPRNRAPHVETARASRRGGVNYTGHPSAVLPPPPGDGGGVSGPSCDTRPPASPWRPAGENHSGVPVSGAFAFPSLVIRSVSAAEFLTLFRTMPALWIETPRARLRLESQRLLLVLPGAAEDQPGVEHHLPMAEIDRVILSESASITTPALGELMRRDIPVTLHATNGGFLGSFFPAGPAHSATRLQQYRMTCHPAFCLEAARSLILAKVAGQRRLLQRLEATRSNADVHGILQRMDALAPGLGLAGSLDELRGLEGMASQLYFQAWEQFLPPDFPFAGRSTRPPKNPVNAVLSYASAVLYGEVLNACHRRGLDPGLGCLHTTQDRRWSLPLDLMEPFRPAVSEALTLRLFAHRMLPAERFEIRDGGVFLDAEGRRTLLRDYEKRLHRPFVSPRSGLRSTLRQEMDATVLSFKAALDGTTAFQPYKLH